jgi:hypothetical protein
MPPIDGSQSDVTEEARCGICGRELWSDGLPLAQDGTAWICGDCDQARTFESLDPDA